jgi:hypothetical protein
LQRFGVFLIGCLEFSDKATKSPVDGRAPDRRFGTEPLVQEVVADPEVAAERAH